MSFDISCPACGAALNCDDSMSGKHIRCADCQEVFLADRQSALDEQEILTTEIEPTGQSGKAVASLVLGICAMIAWCLPILGLPVTIIGLVLGIKGQNSSNRGLAIAGIVLNIIGLVLSIVNAAIGAYMGATGQHPLFR